MASTKPRGGSLREMVHPSANETLKSNSHSCVKLLKTVGEFINKVCVIKEQSAHQLLSAVETFKKKNTEMKKERCALSSAMSLWETLLMEYETEAQDMLKTRSRLTKDVSGSLAQEASKRKMMYKKIFAFRDAGENRIEKADEARQKCHKDYCDACSKLAKAQNTDQSKEAKQEHYITMCHNAHNSYVIQLNATNGMADVFYAKTFPEMLDDLQIIQEETTNAMAQTFKLCAQIERQNHEDRSKRLSSFEGMFDLINISQDIDNFVKSNSPGFFMPQKRTFEKPEDGTVVSVPDGKLSVHAVTEPVLKRKYITLEKKFRHLNAEVDKERYTQNPSYGRAEDLDINLLTQRNELRLKEMYRDITSEQLNLFTPEIMTRLQVSDDDLQDEKYDDDESLTNIYDKRQSVISNVMSKPKTTRAARHEFVEHNFKKPHFCYYCNKLLKGLIKQGVKCKTCRMGVHHKCQENVPDCTGSPPTTTQSVLRRSRTLPPKPTTVSDDFSSDDQTYSDIDEAPTPPLRRKSLSRRKDDFYDTAEECLSRDMFAVALYDYAGENEGDMPLRAGDKLEISNSTDESWWEGKCGKVSGFFPAAYVQAISSEDTVLRCLFDFAGQDKDELTVAANQIVIKVRDEGNGWVVVRTGTVEGAIPSSYVEKINQ